MIQLHYRISSILPEPFKSGNTVEWLFFPNFSFLGVPVYKISEERAYIFSVSNLPFYVYCKEIIYQRVYTLLSQGQDFSVFIRSRYALYCFFLC